MISVVDRCFIIIFLAIQIYLPLDYYIFREDKMDERFAWRMFSDINLSRVEVVFTQESMDGDMIPLDITNHMPRIWAHHVKRGYSYLLRRVCEHLCEKIEGRAVHVGATVYPPYRDFPRVIAQFNVSCHHHHHHHHPPVQLESQLEQCASLAIGCGGEVD